MSYNYDLFFCATKLCETKILTTTAEKEKLETYLKSSWHKKYSNKDISYFCPNIKQKVISALWSKLEELEAIKGYSIKKSEAIEAYMVQNKLSSILVDSKKHRRVLISYNHYCSYPTNLTYQQPPGTTNIINGKHYYTLSHKDVDKVCSGKIFDDFLLINSKYMKFYEKYSGLTENICVFLDIDNSSRAMNNQKDPIILGGIGEGLILVDSGYNGMRVERVENVKVII